MAAPPVPSINIYDRKLPVVASDLILLHLRGFLRKPVEAPDIYFLEAVGDETAVRGRGAKALRDVRSLGEVVPLFERRGFVRIHRNHAVNPQHIREIRHRKTGSDWEVKFQPPVNRVLPVSRRRLRSRGPLPPGDRDAV